MNLAGQDMDRRGEAGHAMAALLVAIAVMAILMSAAMPSWRQQMQREREAELIWRGEQYARAVGLFQRKFAGAFPPNLDVLLNQKFLRKRYKDPITGGDFQVLYQGAATQPGAVAPPVPGAGPGDSGRGPAPLGQPQVGPGAASTLQAGTSGGLIGVTSKSKATSIRLYNGRSKYNEWYFVYTSTSTQPGVAPGAARPGMMPGGQPGRQPGIPTPPGPGGRGLGGIGGAPPEGGGTPSPYPGDGRTGRP